MSIGKQLISGTAYIAIAKYSGVVISLIVSAILARLISPADFGIVAIAMVIIAFFSIFSDLGIAPAIVQNKQLSDEDMSQLFSFTVWVAIILTACFFAVSWGISHYYNAPQLVAVCQLLSVNVFFATLNIVPNALLLRNKEFRFIAIRSFGVQCIAGIIAIAAAYAGQGIYALLINPILSSIGIFALSIVRYPQRFRLTLGLQATKKIFAYSSYQFLFNVINYFSRNLDKLLIGKYLGMSPLGYYEKSYRLMMLPLQNITHVITPVMHPVFSDFQNDRERLSASYLKVVRLLAFIGFPLSAMLWFMSREVVIIIFGNQWEASVGIFQILSLSVGIQIVLSTSGSIFQAANDTRMLFVSGLISTVINITGIVIGVFIFRSLTSVAWLICLTFTLNFAISYYLMYRYTLRLSIRPLIKQLLSPLALCAILTAVLYAINLADIDNLWIGALVKGTASIVICALYLQLTNEYDIYKLFKSKMR